MDFTAAILKLTKMSNYSKNQALETYSYLRDVSEPNGTAHGAFRAETNLLSYTIC